jgi:hypothetical protein
VLHVKTYTPKSQTFRITSDTFRWTVQYFIISKKTKRKELVAFLNKMRIVPEFQKETLRLFDEGGTILGEHFYYDKWTGSCIITQAHGTRDELVATLVHENRHAVDSMIQRYGIKDRETPAHLEQFLIEEALQKI